MILLDEWKYFTLKMYIQITKCKIKNVCSVEWGYRYAGYWLRQTGNKCLNINKKFYFYASKL